MRVQTMVSQPPRLLVTTTWQLSGCWHACQTNCSDFATSSIHQRAVPWSEQETCGGPSGTKFKHETLVKAGKAALS
jgi:hypothetical protein